MEYYILENEESYIKETIIDITGTIKHNTTNNVEEARRYSTEESAREYADFFNCDLVKINITKEKLER